MRVREAMTKPALTIGPEHTLRQAAQQMSALGVGSAIVADPESEGIGILTERDILVALGGGLDPDVERVTNHLTWDVVYAVPDWTLQEAALTMIRGGFRHLAVLDGGEVQGMLSVRDIVRVWAHDR